MCTPRAARLSMLYPYRHRLFTSFFALLILLIPKVPEYMLIVLIIPPDAIQIRCSVTQKSPSFVQNRQVDWVALGTVSGLLPLSSSSALHLPLSGQSHSELDPRWLLHSIWIASASRTCIARLRDIKGYGASKRSYGLALALEASRML